MRLFHWRFLGQDSFKILCQSQVDVGPSRKCRLAEVFAKSDLALHLDQRLLKEEDVLLEQGAALGLLDSFNPSHPRRNSFARDSLQNGAILKEDTQATTGRGSVARVLILKPMGLETHTNLAQDRGFVPMRKPGYAATQTGVLTLKLKGKSIVSARASPKSKTL